MQRNTVTMIVLAFFAVGLAWGAAQQSLAQDANNPYPTSMAPIDQYPMDRDAEIAMARSAAPPSFAKDATIMVFGRDGYETAIKGTNGFVCNVDRSWMDRFEKSREFWNPKRRGPVCYNPQAGKTMLPILLIRTKLALAGKSKDEMKEGMKAAVEKGELPAIEPGGMAYMLSKQGHLNDICGNCAPNLMFYLSLKDADNWAAGTLGSGSVVELAPHFNGNPEPVTELNVVVPEWSDGTMADSGDHAH